MLPQNDRPHGRLERDFPCQYMLSWNDRLHGRLRELPCQDSATEIHTLKNISMSDAPTKRQHPQTPSRMFPCQDVAIERQTPRTPSRRYPYQDVTAGRLTTDPTDTCKAMSMSRCFNRKTESGCRRPTDPTDTFKKVSISRCYNRTTDDKPHRRLQGYVDV